MSRALGPYPSTLNEAVTAHRLGGFEYAYHHVPVLRGRDGLAHPIIGSSVKRWEEICFGLQVKSLAQNLLTFSMYPLQEESVGIPVYMPERQSRPFIRRLPDEPYRKIICVATEDINSYTILGERPSGLHNVLPIKDAIACGSVMLSNIEIGVLSTYRSLIAAQAAGEAFDLSGCRAKPDLTD